MLVLGFETSCDETGIGLVDSEHGVVGEAIFSQTEIHREYGGVVPELASRDHLRRLSPLLQQALGSHSLTEVDAIAYTKGPGLVGALMTGAVFAHGLAWSLAKPAMGVHHLEAHLLVCGMQERSLKPPYLALLVSGGHTQLIEVQGLGAYRLLGETLDDAVGEAFDKVARMLGLSYPGGAAVEHLARKGRADRFEFPRPMSKRADLNFSFSGLKTKVLRTLQQHDNDEQCKADVALAFESAAIDSLYAKCHQAIEQSGLRKLIVAGGVAANTHLRKRIETLQEHGVQVYFPPHELCTDNGVMIAYAGLLHLQSGASVACEPQVHARLPLSELSPSLA